VNGSPEGASAEDNRINQGPMLQHPVS